MDIKNQFVEARNEYAYTASGQKLKMKSRWNQDLSRMSIMTTGDNNSTFSESKVTDYAGNKIYENGKLKRILIDGGYVAFSESKQPEYHYYLSDHLGNNRVVAKANGEVIQKTHFYPFGMSFADSEGTNEQPYLYNGKEYDGMHGLNLYDYAARYYDPEGVRFTSIDPLAEKYYSWSPYAYVMNNPLKYIDPDGRFAWLPVLYFVGKAAAGALADVGTQVTMKMGQGQEFSEALSNVDWTSVGSSALISGIAAPGMSTAAKVTIGTAIAGDALVDITAAEGINTSVIIGGDKSLEKTVIDASANILSTSIGLKITNSTTKELSKELGSTVRTRIGNSVVVETVTTLPSKFSISFSGDRLKEITQPSDATKVAPLPIIDKQEDYEKKKMRENN